MKIPDCAAAVKAGMLICLYDNSEQGDHKAFRNAVKRETKGFFVLSNNVQNINNKITGGTCPHGLMPGACPVCSMSGGGTLRQSDRNRKIGEMTYHECAMIGNMMKARELAQKNHENTLKHRALNLQNFETQMAKISEKLAEFVKFASQSIVTKPVAIAVKFIALPLIAVLQTLPKIFNFINNIRFEITDKLNAVYGEAKAFLQKKIEQGLEILKKAGRFILKIFRKNNSDDEDTKIDDDKKIFNLKTILQKITKKIKERKEK